MKTMKIIKELKDIENIAKFQQERIKDITAVNKDLILRHAINVIIYNCSKIEENI